MSLAVNPLGAATRPRPTFAGLSATSWMVVGLSLAAALLMAVVQSWDGTQRAVIPTTIATIIAMRKKANADDDAAEIEPSHKVTKFIWGVVNSGDYEDLDKHVADELVVTLNGTPVGSIDPGMTGAEALRATIESWRSLMPDLHWALLDEVEDKDRLALRFEVTGTPDVDNDEGWSGEPLKYQVGAFLHLDKKKVCEAHQYIDLQQIDSALDKQAPG